MSHAYAASQSPLAWDDPVPSGSSAAVVAPEAIDDQPHAIEWAVRRELACQEGIHFRDLVVRRLQDGVCLEGVMETDDGGVDLADVVRKIAGVERVINHLLILPGSSLRCEAEEDAVSLV
jgi:hypothetical protein